MADDARVGRGSRGWQDRRVGRVSEGGGPVAGRGHGAERGFPVEVLGCVEERFAGEGGGAVDVFELVGHDPGVRGRGFGEGRGEVLGEVEGGREEMVQTHEFAPPVQGAAFGEDGQADGVLVDEDVGVSPGSGVEGAGGMAEGGGVDQLAEEMPAVVEG